MVLAAWKEIRGGWSLRLSNPDFLSGFNVLYLGFLLGNVNKFVFAVGFRGECKLVILFDAELRIVPEVEKFPV
jgi:hypothetical protein